MRKNTLLDLQLKDYVKPVCSRPYPVTRLHKMIPKKEVKIIVKLGVLEEENTSEWGAPYFAQPMATTNWVRFLSDFRNLNRNLRRKPYAIPKIHEMILNLKGF